MENKEKTEPIYYELTDKHFWAAFLNLARHNVYTTVNHINKLLEIAELKNDEDVHQRQLEQTSGKTRQKGPIKEPTNEAFSFLGSRSL